MDPLNLNQFKTKHERELRPLKSSRPPRHKGGEWFVKGPIPGKWISTIVGAVVGIILAVAFNLLVESEAFWIEYVGYFLVALCAILGRGLGAAMDWRDEDHEALVNRK